MASAILATYVVPEIGGLVVEALVSMCSLCKKMKENETLCQRVYERLQFVADELAKITDEEMLQQNRVLFLYGATIANFVKFLQKHSDKSMLKRLAGNRKVVEAIQDFHEDIDEIFKLLNLVHMQEMAKWRQEWEEDRARQQEDLTRILSGTEALRDELHSQHLVEELATLKFELNYKSDKNPSEQMALMKTAFDKIVNLTQTSVPDVPKWFIDGDDVEFDAKNAFGCGSYGSVYRGKWGKGTEVVVKVLLVDDDAGKQSFLKETEVWAELSHPHIIGFFGACHISTPAFFVCEDAIHGNFFEYFDANGTTQLWRLFYEAGLGLHYLHGEKVVHGDLKCSNLLVGSDDKAKVSDFGFSYIRKQSVGLSAKAQSDTVRWKAPECLMVTGAEPDADHNPGFASDVFSFGMCIIEAFSGEPPYGTADEDDIIEKLLDGELYPRPDGLKDDEWELVERMRCDEPEERISLSAAIDVLKMFANREALAQLKESQVRACLECEASNPADFNFCGKCGVGLDTDDSDE